MRFAAVILLCTAACATSGPAEGPKSTENVRTAIGPQQALDLTQQHMVKETLFTRPRSEVWKALLETHAALGFSVDAANETTGRADFAARDRSRIIAGKSASLLIDCGQGPVGPRADSYRLTITIRHQLNDVPDGTSLKSVVEASARNPGLSCDPVTCSSTGRLESDIANILTVRLK